jgi:hypothetical protein
LKPSGHVACDFHAKNGATCDRDGAGIWLPSGAFEDLNFFLLIFALDLRILENGCRWQKVNSLPAHVTSREKPCGADPEHSPNFGGHRNGWSWPRACQSI